MHLVHGAQHVPYIHIYISAMVQDFFLREYVKDKCKNKIIGNTFKTNNTINRAWEVKLFIILYDNDEEIRICLLIAWEIIFFSNSFSMDTGF